MSQRDEVEQHETGSFEHTEAWRQLCRRILYFNLRCSYLHIFTQC